jgi:ubiquitin conjugation factor E4 B
VQNPVNEVQQASAALEKIRDLVISYAGLNLQEPAMFPQPPGCVSNFALHFLVLTAQRRRETGPCELIAPLLSLSAFSTPLSASSFPDHVLTPMEVEPFLQDLARRFEPDGEIDGVLGPVVRQLLFHESLLRPDGLGGGDSSWRSVVAGVEALVSIKSIAGMFTRLDDWNPLGATAPTFEKVALMGPLCRLGVFSREWVREIMR